MKFVVQRVEQSSVYVREECVGSIHKGLLVLAGIGRGDTHEQMQWMIDKLLGLRIFSDAEGKMNDSISDVKGELLMVPNFTLYADASSGNRPGFSAAESPGKAQKLYHSMIAYLQNSTDLPVAAGRFGADMKIHLINDGPVTIILER